MRLLLILSFSLLTFSIKAQQANDTIKNVDAAAFKTMIEKNDGVLIDLRTPDEVKKGIIKGATVIDYLAKDFSKKIAKLDKSKKYYIYCQAGGRSGDAAGEMKNLGFTSIVNLTKGYSDWLKKGFPVVTN